LKLWFDKLLFEFKGLDIVKVSDSYMECSGRHLFCSFGDMCWKQSKYSCTYLLTVKL